MISIRDYARTVSQRLSAVLGSEAEGEAACRIIMEDVAGYSRSFIFANGDRPITDFMQGKVDAVVSKIEQGMPVQYAVGKAMFMGNMYTVTPAVLIPRPETAALVDMITARYGSHSDLRVLDIGTGSGCIAISLARALAFARVEAIDISADALAVAAGNARDLAAKVDFRRADILSEPVPERPLYDIIVSNPPYICQSEKAEMDERVSAEEPATALFVPDDDPLVFYRAIARYAMGALVPGGGLFLEINSRFPDEMRTLLSDEGFTDVDVTRDFKGNYRYATATKPADR